jgi:hypothetical protein
MNMNCPHCGGRITSKDGMVKCSTKDCGEWKSAKEFYMSGFRAYYRAFTEKLKMPKTYGNLEDADEFLHQAMRFLKEHDKL